MAQARATLYVIPGSHACRSAILMLAHKRIAHRTVELPTGLHPLLVRALGFPGHRRPIRSLQEGPHRPLVVLDRLGTVPALRLHGRHVQTNLAIAAFLEEERPDPPLYPPEPDRRREVSQAAAWGDEVLQMAARRIVLAAGARGLDELRARGGTGRLGALLAHSDPLRAASARMAGAVAFRVDADVERRLLAELPAQLDRVDEWLAAGVLGGPELGTADFMIAPSLALLAYRHDLRPDIEARPLGAFVERVLPEPASPPAPVAAPAPAV
jgi:glutathione S-transferase